MNLPEKNLDTPFNITRTSHVVLTVKDLEQSRLFYTEVVGLDGHRADRRHALSARRRGGLPPQPGAQAVEGRARAASASACGCCASATSSR